jgi:uncharacterized membrane protein YgaE (UPF0421/DUF939 family)
VEDSRQNKEVKEKNKIKSVSALYSEIREFKDVTTFDKLLFDKVEELIIKVNELVEVMNSLEHDDPKTASIQNRGGSNA